MLPPPPPAASTMPLAPACYVDTPRMLHQPRPCMLGQCPCALHQRPGPCTLRRCPGPLTSQRICPCELCRHQPCVMGQRPLPLHAASMPLASACCVSTPCSCAPCHTHTHTHPLPPVRVDTCPCVGAAAPSVHTRACVSVSWRGSFLVDSCIKFC